MALWYHIIPTHQSKCNTILMILQRVLLHFRLERLRQTDNALEELYEILFFSCQTPAEDSIMICIKDDLNDDNRRGLSPGAWTGIMAEDGTI